ncbi:hypothetical protein K7X08_005064 [Anisodus acutangulus]|uniref:Uncharacterized protein n=1 Tax=Anisodus acutangulus TaxID=402998 RepID=A0A9Q1RG57_9SOLA|nr:hypothetical protein K7X08_005064 [Anisodus acutangulus]
MALLFFLYLYVVSRATSRGHPSGVVKTARKEGLSVVQLQKLPKITGKGLSLGNDCAICLDVIGNEELARHKLEPELFTQDETIHVKFGR